MTTGHTIPRRRFSIFVEGFRPYHSNTLRGFITIVIPEIKLRIVDLTVHEMNGKRWISMPGKPQLDRDGNVRKDPQSGKILYTSVIEFTSKEVRDRFNQRVIAALLEIEPGVFEEEDAA